ncbi:hypothetical protein AB0D38_38405 [Streptomyces sp. NPDC048279]|uniref:hypothetical protein n=1 Tax=Streptomyces sp. NPDC048279 TaxID=3154714 RepID=UPI003435366F
MGEMRPEGKRPEPAVRQTSDEKVGRSPGHQVVETALEVTGHTLGGEDARAHPGPAPGPYPSAPP